ncbi:MAG: hypothetical protein ABIF77_00065 [bacterium]
MDEEITIRLIELPGRRLRISNMGALHCSGCRLLANTRNWCALFGKKLVADNPMRLQECVDSEVPLKEDKPEQDPEPEPIRTVAWTPRQ